MAPSAPKPNARTRIAVIGGGVIGLSCAWELARRGASVAVYERGTALGAGATIRSAGMLAAAFEWAAEAEYAALARMAARSGVAWAEFASRLERDGGGSVEYSREGALVVARLEAELEWLEGLELACQARGLEVRRLGAQELQRLEPKLTAQVRGALLLPQDRQVDPALLLQRLERALGRAGVEIKLGRPVERIICNGGFELPDGDRFDQVLIATGIGPAIRFERGKGDDHPTGLPEMVPVKGQMLVLAPGSGAPRHVVHGRDIYIAPKARWTLVGATNERGKADTAIDRTIIEGLRARAADLAGGLADAPEAGSWAGIRPATEDGLPIIGATAIADVFAAMGHYRNGVLLAPENARMIADQMLEGRSAPEAAAFSPLRFDKRAAPSHSR
jgi:glycine oxidase ThiO